MDRQKLFPIIVCPSRCYQQYIGFDIRFFASWARERHMSVCSASQPINGPTPPVHTESVASLFVIGRQFCWQPSPSVDMNDFQRDINVSSAQLCGDWQPTGDSYSALLGGSTVLSRSPSHSFSISLSLLLPSGGMNAR